VNLTLAELNALSADRAAELLTACCGSTRWVSAMVARRPFASFEAMLDTADAAWRQLEDRDWLEAFTHHPRIGEHKSAAPQAEGAARWSAGEQAKVSSATVAARDDLALMNREYEERFGYIYIVCATGKSADELLAIARSRLHNDPATELRTAAEEQRQITNLRLRKLIAESA
jgi:OHCU decarboxylase